MAIVDKPEFDQDETLILEDSDDQQEDAIYGGFIDIVREKYNRSKDKRLSDEERWLRAYKNYRGVYDDTTKFTETERSQVFIKVTKTKVLAAYSQIIDVLFAGNKFPIGIEPTQIPEGIKDTVHVDAAVPDQLQEIYDELNVGYAGDSTEIPEGAVRPGDINPIKEQVAGIEEDLKAGPGNTPMKTGHTLRSCGRCLALKRCLSGTSILILTQTI